MKVIPAIDIIGGKAVRLFQGDYNKTDFIGQDVLELAKSFVDSGADLIHLVDLDGAKAGKLVNKDTILEVIKTLKVDIEVGGGIRNYDDIKALIDGGVARVILGTVAIENRDLLDQISEYLLEKETIYGDEFMEFVTKKYPELKKKKVEEKPQEESDIEAPEN